MLGPDCQHVRDATFAANGAIPKQSTVTITIASPGVVTWNANGLALGTPIIFTTTGALPTPLTAVPANSNPIAVYAIPIDANSFKLATSVANALAGVAINTSGGQSGVQTAIANAVVAAGYVGETLWNTIPLGSAFALTTGSAGQTWNSLSVPPGIWIVWAQPAVIGAGGAVFTHMHAGYGNGISSIPTSPDNGTVTALHLTSNATNGWLFPEGPREFWLTATASMNANMTVDFSPGTASAYGTIFARRLR